MSNSSQYEALYRDLVANIEEMHRLNVKKTGAALKSLLIVPTIFLIMLFLTSSSKSIFLVLWIVSMFVIAGILIVIEYQDYKLQLMLSGIKDKEAALPPHGEEEVPDTDHSSAPVMQKAAQIRQSIYSRAPSEDAPAEPETQPEPEPESEPADAAVSDAQPEAECTEPECAEPEQAEEDDLNSELITK